MFYTIDKRTGKIEYVEQSVLMVPQFKAVITYYKHVKYPKYGWLFMDMLVMLCSSRSPYNKSTWTEDEKYERVAKAAYANLSRELATTSASFRPPAPSVDQLKLSIFQDAMAAFMELDYDIVMQEYLSISKQYKSLVEKINDFELESATDTENKESKLSALLKLLGEMKTQYENCKKILFESNKTKDKTAAKFIPPISKIHDSID